MSKNAFIGQNAHSHGKKRNVQRLKIVTLQAFSPKAMKHDWQGRSSDSFHHFRTFPSPKRQWYKSKIVSKDTETYSIGKCLGFSPMFPFNSILIT